MKSRRAPKYILFLGFALLLACAAGGVWYRSLRNDPQRYERRGDLLFEAGNYAAAFGQYAHALSLEDRAHGEAQLLKKMAESLLLRDPLDLHESLDNSARAMPLLERAGMLAPSDDELAKRVLDGRFDIAVRIGTADAWRGLERTSRRILRGNPSQAKAAAYKVIAAANLLTQQPVRAGALRELLGMYATLPAGDADASLAWAHVAGVLLRVADKQRDAGEHQEWRTTALKMADAAVHDGPPSLRAQVARARIHLEHDVRFPEHAAYAETGAMLEQLSAQLLDSPESAAGLEFAWILLDVLRPVLPTAHGIEEQWLLETAANLAHALEPLAADDLEVQTLQAFIAKLRGDSQAALEMMRRIRDARHPIYGLAAPTVHWVWKSTAAVQVLDILLADVRDVTDSAERERQLIAAEEAMEAIEELARTAGVSWTRSILLRGQLDDAWGDHRLAALNFQAYRRAVNSPEAVAHAKLHWGRSLTRLGEFGSAEQMLREVATDSAAAAAARREAVAALTDALLGLRRFEDARSLAEGMYHRRPDTAESAISLGRVLVATARDGHAAADKAELEQWLSRATTMLYPHVTENNRKATLLYAEARRLQGHDTAALHILEQYHEQYPGDRAALEQLIALLQQFGEVRRLRELIVKVAQRQSETETGQLLMRALAGSDEVTAELLFLLRLALERDPVLRRIGRAGYHFAHGREAEANRILDEAARLRPWDTRLVVTHVRQLLKAGRIRAAEDLLEAARERNVHAATLAYLRGHLDYLTDRPYRARDLLRKAVDADPHHSHAWLLLSRVNAQLLFETEAFQACRRALSVNPVHAEAWLHLHRLEDDAGMTDRARAALHRAAQASWPTSRVMGRYLDYEAAHGDHRHALRIREQIAAQTPENEENLRRLAQLYLEGGEPEMAESLMRELLERGRQRRANAAVLARILDVSRGTDAAIEFMQTHLADSGENVAAADHALLARMLREYGRTDEAVSEYRQALGAAASVEQHIALTHEYAAWLRELGRLHEAVDVYERCWDQRPRPLTAQHLADLCIQMRRFSKAAEVLDAMESRWNATTETRTLRGRLAAAWGRSDEASRIFDGLIAEYPEDPRPYLQRAQAFFDAADADLAMRVRRDLEAALRMNPHLVQARELLVRWHEQGGERDQTIRHLRLLIRERPRHVPYRTWLATLHVKQGNAAALDGFLEECEQALPGRAVWRDFSAELHLMQGRPERALHQRLLALGWAPSVPRLAAAVEALLEAGQVELGLNLLGSHRAMAEDAALCLALKGRAFMRSGDRQVGMDAFAAALRTADRRPALIGALAAQLNKGLAMSDLIELAGARMDRVGHAGRLALATAYQLKGAHEHAANAFESMREAMPPHHSLYRIVLTSLGGVYALTGEADKALPVQRELHRIEPDSPVVVNNLAVQLARNPETADEAVDLAEKALRRIPRRSRLHAAVLDTLGTAHLTKKRFESAQFAFERSLEIMESPDVYMNLALLAEARGNAAQAEIFLDRAFETAKAKRQPHAMAQCLRKLTDRHLRPPAQAYAAVAAAYLEQGQHESAQSAIRHGLVETGHDLQLQLLQCEYYFRAGQTDRLKAALHTLRERSEADLTPSDRLDLARRCRRYGLVDEGSEFYRQFVASQGGEAGPVWLEYAQWLSDRGQTDQALEILRQASRQDEPVAQKAQLAAVDLLLTSERLEDAARAIARLHAAVPFAERRLREARLAFKQNDLGRTEQLLTYAMSVASMNADLVVEHARLRLDSGSHEAQAAAENSLVTLLQEVPTHQAALDLLARYCEQQMRYDDAARHLHRLQIDNPTRHDYAVRLGRAYLRAGRRQALQRHLSWSRPLHPDNLHLRILHAELLMTRGETQEALELFHEIVAESHHPDAVAAYATAYLAASVDMPFPVDILRMAGQGEFDGAREALAALAHVQIGLGNRRAACRLMARACRDFERLPVKTKLAVHKHVAVFTVDDVSDLVAEFVDQRVPPGVGLHFVAAICDRGGDDNRALDAIDGLREQFGDTSYATGLHVLAAELRVRVGRVQEARRLLDERLRATPADPELLTAAAEVWMHEQHDLVKARALAQQAAETADAGPQVRARAWNVLGRVQHEMGLTRPAQASLAESIRHWDTARGRYDLAMLLIKQGQPQAAAHELRRARFLARTQAESRIADRIDAILSRVQPE